MDYKSYCIGEYILRKRVSVKSFYRWGDKNMLQGSHKIIYANYLSTSGRHIDTLAKEITEAYFIEVDENDIVDFIYSNIKNPFTRKSKPEISYDTIRD